MEELKCEYKRGRAFYQFEHTFERILESDDKEIIFMDEVGNSVKVDYHVRFHHDHCTITEK